MAFVPAVPEAVAGGLTLADLLIALAAFLGWVVCLGLLFAYTYTFGYLLERLADVLDFHVLRVHVDLGAPIRALDNGVKHSLAAGVSTFDHAMGLFFHWAGLLLAWMVNFAAATAQDTLALARWMTHIHLPRYAKWAIRAAFPLAWLTKLISEQIAKALPKVMHIAKGIAHTTTIVVTHPVRAIEAEIAKLRAKVTALAHAVEGYAGAIPLPHNPFTLPKAWRGLTRRLARIERRLHRAEGWLAAGALAVAMANVLGVSARCLRSGNVGKVARRLCGLSPRALEDLLGLIVDALILTNICQVISLMGDALGFIEPELTAFITAAETWACYGDNEHPPTLGAVALALPSTTGIALALP